ncbi:fucolectin-like [Triplophysa rosa]|uniref:fucolectin-like n=1 Tax=Triplophysa rosa TaxID=992332 RepID=UPI002545E3F7|nr:fucolectin-like [Triplophysa rosa]
MDKLIHLILLSGLLCVSGSLAGNLALKGTATHSSTYYDWAAQNAIDGVKYGDAYCSSTSSDSNPWWRLDLLDAYSISTVIITAHDNYLGETTGAEIRIGHSLDNNGNNNPICAVTPDPLPGNTVSLSCNGMEGRYVNVVRSGRTSYLTLCEVQVYETVSHKRKTFLRLKFSSSVDVAAESDKILHQLQSALASHISDFNLSWTQLPEKEEKRMEDRGRCVKTPA